MDLGRKTQRVQRMPPYGAWVGYSAHDCDLGLLLLGDPPAERETYRCPSCRARWVFRQRKPVRRRRSPRKLLNLAAMRDARPEVERRSRGVCEVRIPGVCLGRATNMHHRLPEGQGGPSSAENLIHLCGSGTTGCHGWIEHHRSAAYDRGWLVPMGARPAEVPWHAW